MLNAPGAGSPTPFGPPYSKQRQGLEFDDETLASSYDRAYSAAGVGAPSLIACVSQQRSDKVMIDFIKCLTNR
jgi:hypothetical protein